jgi:hypothetical protein
MRFIAGRELTAVMRQTVKEGKEIKAAIAYWGADALKLLGLNPRRSNVKAICCLQKGKSDPAVVAKFEKRIRQNDRLHAKVLWTPVGAIVGSANASSNGLPEEEDRANSLIEAGIYVDDANTLKSINSWFEAQFKRARHVTKRDLKLAKEARDQRVWGKSPPVLPNSH